MKKEENLFDKMIYEMDAQTRRRKKEGRDPSFYMTFNMPNGAYIRFKVSEFQKKQMEESIIIPASAGTGADPVKLGTPKEPIKVTKKNLFKILKGWLWGTP